MRSGSEGPTRLPVSICDSRRIFRAFKIGRRGGKVTSREPTLRFLTSETEGWQDVDGDAEAAFSSFLTQVLTSRHLGVLCGLGTSRCITDGQGKLLAPDMRDLWQAVKGANEERFQRVLSLASSPSNEENIELLLSRCQMQQELTPDPELAAFIKEGEETIAEKCNFIDDNTSLGTHESFLRKVARRSTKLPRTQLFTTNYDLAFETAAAKIGFAVIDGFSASSPSRFDPVAFERDYARRDQSGSTEPIDWMPNVVQLHKLHGSIDWIRQGAEVLRRGPDKRPLIVYPRSNKFEVSYQQPFLELMGRFQLATRRPATGMIVAGFGFEDSHIAEPFMAAVRGNVGLNVVVISRSLESKGDGVIGNLKKLIAEGDRRIGLVAGSFDAAVKAFPDLVASMEEELHAKRLQAIVDG